MNSITQTLNQEINVLISFRKNLRKQLKKKVVVSFFGCRKEIKCEYNDAVEKALSITGAIILDKIEEFSFVKGEGTLQLIKPEDRFIDKIAEKALPGEEWKTDEKKEKTPIAPKLTLDNYTPTKKQWRVKHNPTSLYLCKAHKVDGERGKMTNLSTMGTICKNKPSKESVINSWFKGKIINRFGRQEGIYPDDITIVRYQ